MTAKMNDKHTVGIIKPMEMLRMVIVLVVTCTAVALLLSVVNGLTEEKIAENLLAAEGEAIRQVFDPDGGRQVEFAPVDNIPESVDAVYIVSVDGSSAGYCVAVSPSGFGGNINMVVGVDSDGKIVGVEITALSETPGLGSLVDDSEYLSAYIGHSSSLTLGGEVDAISGATISSRSVLTGVNRAIAALEEMGLITKGGPAA